MDNVTPISACDKISSALPEKNKLIVKIYVNAYHGFDNSGLPAKKQVKIGTLGYNKTAAESAWIELTQFLLK